MTRRTRTLYLALIASILLHVIFVAVSPYIRLAGVKHAIIASQKLFRIRGLEGRAGDISIAREEDDTQPAIKMSHETTGIDEVLFEKVMPVAKLEGEAIEKKKHEMKAADREDVSGSLSRKMELPDVIKAEAKKSSRRITSERRHIAGEFVSGGMVKAPAGEDGVPGELRSSEISSISPPGKGMSTPLPEPLLKTSPDPVSKEVSASKGPSRIGDYGDISPYLDVDLKTYHDPGTGENFFRVLINVKRTGDLQVMPKEVLFLVDSSKSITEQKLAEIKKGLWNAIQIFNPGDTFNILSFKGNVIKFSETPLRCTERTVESARSFIRDLESTGQTNVERALLDITQEPMRSVPSYVILISDGRPTTGLVDSRNIIQEITRSNDMKRPIFCFGGGSRVNRYLLEFISYQNRAWSGFASSNADIDTAFVGFYREIKDPLLINVRYRSNGLRQDEIFPKYLTDFYMGKPFAIYGRYGEEDIFSMQLLGEIKGATKEFIFAKSLKDASPGDKDIARQWAFRRIYYLISRDSMGLGDPVGLKNEISALCERFGINTSYDLDDTGKD
ncbi:MAG: VWA domain-containing protein [Candidatus Omnitrophica bacterium]|nr:VWA domain-containing protein [Candidatus Omnitrophota bacterium]MDD5487528.1 VWA domain-containing protein [Candidatus Omnitrophota bacterium]